MAALLSATSLGVALTVHAVAAPILFGAVACRFVLVFVATWVTGAVSTMAAKGRQLPA
jgi:hypothetical protein